jgi:hypothetical protein
MSSILRFIPLGFQWETRDPFLFCVHHEDQYPKGNGKLGPAASLAGRHLGQDFIVKDGWRMYHGQTIPGFPGHPHRGFETITVVKKGLVDHADSTGAAGRYGNGDVQWMTAGKGVQHSEMFPLLNEKGDNPAELFQIWLNLPRKSKMVEPHFKMFWNEDIPRYTASDDKNNLTQVEILVGQFEGKHAQDSPPDSWAADAQNHVAVINLILGPNARFTIPASVKGIHRTLYFYSGDKLRIEGETFPEYHGADVDPDVDITLQNGAGGAKVLILQGRPINEPVVQHGPFVMNSKQEIYEAFEEYQRTQFGGWPWPNYDMVHDAKAGRFALHADGILDVKTSGV